MGGVFLAAIAVGADLKAQNHAPNPYVTVQDPWAPLPDGETIWAIDRCGQNSCEGVEDLDIVFEFDKEGNIPHAVRRGDVRLAPRNRRGRRRQRLGVVVAPDGDVFVADGHPSDGNNRIVKFDSQGNYLLEWGETGSEPGQFRTPHALALDDEGLLYVGDRSNRRIQVFDQEGTFVRDFYNLGRARGVTIHDGDNPGFKRGIRVVDLEPGLVHSFIPDPEPDQDNSASSAAEGVAVDNEGNVYGAEVGPRALRKHMPVR